MFLMLITDEKTRTKTEIFYYRYRSLMFIEAYKILGSDELAEDAVNESFVRTIDCINRLSEENCPATRNFFVIVCRNVAIDIARAHHKIIFTGSVGEHIDETPHHTQNPLDIVVNKETLTKMSELVEKLPPKYKDVLYMQNAYKMSREEIAKTLGISIEAVKKRLHRARAILKEQLRKEQERYDKI